MFKIVIIVVLVYMPIKIINPQVDGWNVQMMISNWLVNPQVEIDTDNLTYLISNIPDLDSILSKEEQIEIIEPIIPTFNPHQSESPRILLYNTHQTELYADGISIYEVTIAFVQMLQDEGFEVVFISDDFSQVANEEGLDYSQLYSISRRFVNEAFVNYGGFDLVIDVHRDACDRDVSLHLNNEISYARLMFVIGMKSSNMDEVYELSSYYTDKMQQISSGIMREPFERASIYNQDMFSKMLLLEVGGHLNTSSEALRSLELFAKVLKEDYQ